MKKIFIFVGILLFAQYCFADWKNMFVDAKEKIGQLIDKITTNTIKPNFTFIKDSHSSIPGAEMQLTVSPKLTQVYTGAAAGGLSSIALYHLVRQLLPSERNRNRNDTSLISICLAGAICAAVAFATKKYTGKTFSISNLLGSLGALACVVCIHRPNGWH